MNYKACRYLGSECYCCGYNYEMIENGEICTKFCSIGSYAALKRLCTFLPKHKSCRGLAAEKAKQASIPRKYGERGLIILPFNWGGPAGPERKCSSVTAFYSLAVLFTLNQINYNFEVQINKIGRIMNYGRWIPPGSRTGWGGRLTPARPSWTTGAGR